MKTLVFDRITVFGTLILLAALAAMPAAAQSGDSGNVKTSIGPVVQFGNPSVVVPFAGASMSRNNAGVFGTISTSGLTPGHVVTLWWAFFNTPAGCANTICAPSDLNRLIVNGSLQFGGGQIVGANGRADFSGYVGVGDSSGYFALFPNMPDPPVGLVDPKGAQIHLVIRDHGPASTDAATLSAQLNSFGGGCTPTNTCTNVQAAVFQR